ncbi:MAG TPA: ABC transporter ATP-binding protein [Spirochaetia bacterium]|nr:ABC transporter ATP-binding protein [Spirochaetia bacterium]
MSDEGDAATPTPGGRNGFAVTVRGLTRSFGQFIAVDSISFSVGRGEIFGFLGANGAGKTTTIRMLCGLLAPTAGSGTVAGFDIMRAYESIKLRVGYMSQKFSLYDDLTVRENIEFYGGMYGLRRREIAERSGALFETIGLAEHADKLAGSLPVGWKQRMSLAAALLHDPDIVFLDEPTSGVDPVSRRSFWLLIYELADRGKTLFVTTHYMDEAEYCSRISIMKLGKIAEIENPHELKRRYGVSTMQEVFLKAVGGEEE